MKTFIVLLIVAFVLLLMFFLFVHSKYQVNAAGGKKMRKKYLRELKKNLKESNLFWEDDYQDDKKVEQISLFE